VNAAPLNIKRNSGRQIIRASWSPSFKYVAGILQTPYDPETFSAPLKFVIQDVQSGEEHEISPNLRSYPLSWWTEPQWTPDEKSIFIKGVSKDGITGLYQIDVQTGNTSPYITPMEYPHWVWRWLQFSPDGETQYFVSQDGIGPKQKVIAHAVKSGEEKILTEFNHWVERMSLSPDGKKLAILQDSLWVLPVDGSSAKKNQTNYKVVNGNIIGWSSDSQSIYVASDNTKKDLHLWQISLGNEPAKELFTPEKLKEFKGNYRIKISNVGDEVYLTMENAKRIDEYWAIENIVQK
jgi:Tol biopolymer transport system component